MNVYQQISSNKIRTWVILTFFVLIVTLFFYILGFFFENPGVYLVLGLGISLFSGIFSYYNSDKIVLMFAGAKPADKKEYFDFYTTTENLSIAAGIPMPKLYVIEDDAPNAFATGRSPKHAVVAATTGLLKRLDRSDIEGVVAHELSHIKNYDILIASIVAVLVGTVVFIADMSLRSMWWGGRGSGSRRGSNNAIGLIIFLISIIIIPIAAKIIQLAISRRREYLADSSAVLLTRNPNGLADALHKISGAGPMSRVSHAVSHLYISNPEGVKKTNFLASFFSTHPPVEDRIRILRAMR